MANELNDTKPSGETAAPAFDKNQSYKDAIIRCVKGWSDRQKLHNASTILEGLRTAGVTFENEIEYRRILGEMIDAGTLVLECGGKMGDFDSLFVSLDGAAWLSSPAPKV